MEQRGGGDAGGAGASGRRRGRQRLRRPARRPTLAEALDDEQGEHLGRALAEHASVFRWQRGDVLLIDNARVLHDGMPGFGPRRLRVALLGELPLPQARAHRAFLDNAQKKSC